jgi:hypothetical protein
VRIEKKILASDKKKDWRHKKKKKILRSKKKKKRTTEESLGRPLEAKRLNMAYSLIPSSPRILTENDPGRKALFLTDWN